MDGLRLVNVHKSYKTNSGRSNEVLQGINFCLKEGKTVSLLGESGCGKSTLARIILGIESLDDGEVKLNDMTISSLSYKEFRKIRSIIQGVFQDSSGSLNPKLSVLRNMEEGVKNLKDMTSEERVNEIYYIMNKLGLSKELLKRSVVNLSGGEQRRVALIRALAVKPKILVLDEVTSGLDKESKIKVINLLKAYRLNFQCSILLITHDREVAYELSDTILLLENGKITKKAERI